MKKLIFFSLVFMSGYVLQAMETDRVACLTSSEKMHLWAQVELQAQKEKQQKERQEEQRPTGQGECLGQLNVTSWLSEGDLLG